jgi:hypothetical protein
VTLATRAPRAIADATGAAWTSAAAFVAALGLAAGTRWALVLAALPLLVVLMSKPQVAGVLGVAAVPFAADLLPGFVVKVSLPDILLLVAATATVLKAGLAHAALRPLRLPVLAYAAALVVAIAAHPGLGAVINAGQRLQIVLIALIVGAVTLTPAALQRALAGYVMVASVLGVAWAVDVLPPVFEYQKNPVGQFLAGALLVVIANPKQRLRLLAVVPLSVGLFTTESRGAILGLLVGVAAMVLAQPGLKKLRVLGVLVPFLIVFGFVYASLSDDVQARTETLSAAAGDQSEAAYTIRIREAYRKDALELISQNKAAGVGIGQYLAGDLKMGTRTSDPHNVLLLDAAEGGLPLLATFVLLVLGSGLAVGRHRRTTPLASLAVGVQAATVAHGLVDIYWVRGTPLLGWLLVGATLADARRRAGT